MKTQRIELKEARAKFDTVEKNTRCLERELSSLRERNSKLESQLRDQRILNEEDASRGV